MRWERLWSDLEAQAEALDRDELEAEVADRTLIEQGTVLLMDRVRASVGLHLRCVVVGGQQWRGPLLGYGLDWLSLGWGEAAGAAPASEAEYAPGRAARQVAVLLPARSLTAVAGLARLAVPLDAVGLVARRVTLPMAMRRLLDAGAYVRVDRVGSTPLAGQVALVGRDYVDLVDDDAMTWSIPLASVVSVALS